ncbi:hypothetical protein HDU81_005287 [Chytriomyces hyalinus]|nr:hypothetical protein HDU81_005287 [Chytriomyces hyalinus]
MEDTSSPQPTNPTFVIQNASVNEPDDTNFSTSSIPTIHIASEPDLAQQQPKRTRLSRSPKKRVLASELHAQLLEERNAELLQKEVSFLQLVESTKAELKTKQKHFAEEEYASLLHESRNRHMNVSKVLLLEHADQIVHEKQWVSDLTEKERMGKVVAQLEVKRSHCVLECQKVCVEKAVKEEDAHALRERREMALQIISDLALLQRNLKEFCGF